MNVLFIGGTGVISSACARAAVAAGMQLTLLNRGRTQRSTVPIATRVIQGDMRDAAWARRALGGQQFDVVVDWIAYTPEHVKLDVELFFGRVRQYVFISSATVYRMPAERLPITETMPRGNPSWRYARDKIACEDVVLEAFQNGFPATIVRPSHTYDLAMLPVRGGWTSVDRMRRGLPTVIPGNGRGLWTLTHHEDFARGFVGLLGLQAALGEAVHITSDEALSWNDIHMAIAHAAGAELRPIYVPVEVIASVDAEWGESLQGDKAHDKVFDNAKIKRLVPGFRAVIPYGRAAAAQVAWYDADPARRVVDPAFDATITRLINGVRGGRSC
jgi:nucleoside-diphosphate-sugar epimerase